MVDGQSQVGRGTMISYDDNIIVEYHMKKEIKFSFNMSKMTVVQVATALGKLRFTNIYLYALNDLKNKKSKKDKFVHKIVLDDIRNLKEGMELEYDTKITIQYHSFPE